MKPLQIAIAHQNAATLEALHAAVLRMGHVVCVRADNGGDLAAEIRLQHPDMVIVQEFLPELESLRDVTRADGVEIPAIVLLDRNNGTLMQRPDSGEVLGILQEPVRDSDLIPVIPLVMERFKQRQALQESIELLKFAIDGGED